MAAEEVHVRGSENVVNHLIAVKIIRTFLSDDNSVVLDCDFRLGAVDSRDKM